jgi:hypothetical protein
VSRGRKGPAYWLLFSLSAILAAGALLSLVPNPDASWPNILGYSSLCTFTPAAAFACALLAALTCIIRARLVLRRPSPIFVPIAAILVLGGLFAWSTLAWAGTKAKYTDAASSASPAE